MPDTSGGIRYDVATALQRELEDIRARPRPEGEEPDDLTLVGLAFSGGGIRSATFNLGVLQGLENVGLLRFVDYLSTVSGGGYIGSWYLSCLKEKLTDGNARQPAVAHLRKFSRYLAPAAGFFSADTWTIATNWLRNTLLLQAMLVSLFALLLLLPRFFQWAFLNLPLDGVALAAAVLFAAAFAQIAYRLGRIRKPSDPQGLLQITIVVPLLAAGACFSSVLWRSLNAPEKPLWWAGAFVAAATCLTAFISLLRYVRAKPYWWAGVVTIGILCGGLFASLAFTLSRAYLEWAALDSGAWLAGMFGAPALLISLALSVVLQIGLLGRAIDDSRREWWSLMGAFLAIYSAAALALGVAAVYGPELVRFLTGATPWKWIGGSLTLGGVATTVGGLLAARSRDTGPGGSNSAKELAASAAPYVFIVGVAVAVSAGLHRVLHAYSGCAVGTVWYELSCSILNAHFLQVWLATGISAAVLLLLAWRVDINEASMGPFYRNRLVRCYMGAATQAIGKRHPNLFTGFDFLDDYALAELRPTKGYAGPVPIVNTALNLTGGDNAALQERRATSFFFTPCQSGSKETDCLETRNIGKFWNGILLGACVGASGAAASPNMGYHTSAPVAFLMTFFNVRLGLWIRNPRAGEGKQNSRWGLYYLLKELFATADVGDNYVYLSDGGHFDNLGVYELVRRRCRYIIACDAEADQNLVLEALGGLVRKCRIDFDTEIDIDTAQIRRKDEQGLSRAHCAVGRISYPAVPGKGAASGYLIYLKSSLTGDEDSDILQYKAQNSAFPHESTGDQFFSESQFESYRALGVHVVERAFARAGRGVSGAVETRTHMDSLMMRMEEAWKPPSPFTEPRFGRHAEQLNRLWDEIRKAQVDPILDRGLYPGWSLESETPGYASIRQGLYFYQIILQLMETVYLDLHLDTMWDHPDNEGWKKLFQHWAKSPALQNAYEFSGHTYGSRFRYFCEMELGLVPGTAPENPSRG